MDRGASASPLPVETGAQSGGASGRLVGGERSCYTARMPSPAVEAAQAALDAKKAELAVVSAEFQALRADLEAARAAEQDALDAETPAEVADAQNGNGNQKNRKLAVLYRKRLAEILDAKSEERRNRAIARAQAALGAGEAGE